MSERFTLCGCNLPIISSGGSRWIALRHACEQIGLDYAAQLKRLQDPDYSHWASTTMLLVADTTGRMINMVGVNLDSVPFWLMTVQTSRVSDSAARVRIRKFQSECCSAPELRSATEKFLREVC